MCVTVSPPMCLRSHILVYKFGQNVHIYGRHEPSSKAYMLSLFTLSECAAYRCSLAVEAQWNGHYYTTGRKGRWGSCIVCIIKSGHIWMNVELQFIETWWGLMQRRCICGVWISFYRRYIYIHLIVFCAKHGRFLLLTDTTGVICALFGPLRWGHLDKDW